MTFKVEMIKKPAAIILPDNTRLDGSFFVSTGSPSHPGIECISELLSNDKQYLPFELTDGEVALLRKKNIVLIQLKEDALLRPPYGRQIAVRMRLLSGRTMDGMVFSDLPENQSRLSDFLNAGQRFFYLEAKGLNYFVNSQFILTIRPGTTK